MRTIARTILAALAAAALTAPAAAQAAGPAVAWEYVRSGAEVEFSCTAVATGVTVNTSITCGVGGAAATTILPGLVAPYAGIAFSSAAASLCWAGTTDGGTTSGCTSLSRPASSGVDGVVTA